MDPPLTFSNRRIRRRHARAGRRHARRSRASAPTRAPSSRATSSFRSAAKISMATLRRTNRRTRRGRRAGRERLEGKRAEKFRAHSRSRHARRAINRSPPRYRQSLPLKVIAITGSNGKTSTKDFVAAALGRRFRVTKTEGNFNNHVGLPRTMLEATAEARNRGLGIGHESSRRDRRARRARRARCRHHHQHRDRAHRVHGFARSDRAGKRRARGSDRERRHHDLERGRSLQRSDRASHAGAGLSSPESSAARSARKTSRKARAAPSSRSWKARIVAARNCRCPACTWCRTRCSRSRPDASLACRSKNAPAGSLPRRSRRRGCNYAKSAACNFSTTATTRIRNR